MKATHVRKHLDGITCPIRRLGFLEDLAGVEVNTSINDRAWIQSEIDFYKLPDGSMEVLRWQRDCDGAESTDRYRIHATLLSYNLEYQSVSEQAEGSFNLTIVPPQRSKK